MALSTYDELKASIADFLNRDDLTSVIPDFIKLAETGMNREVRRLIYRKINAQLHGLRCIGVWRTEFRSGRN